MNYKRLVFDWPIVRNLALSLARINRPICKCMSHLSVQDDTVDRRFSSMLASFLVVLFSKQQLIRLMYLQITQHLFQHSTILKVKNIGKFFGRIFTYGHESFRDMKCGPVFPGDYQLQFMNSVTTHYTPKFHEENISQSNIFCFIVKDEFYSSTN